MVCFLSLQVFRQRLLCAGCSFPQRMACLVVVRKRLLVSLTLRCGGFSFQLSLVSKQLLLCQIWRMVLTLLVQRRMASAVFFPVVRKGSLGFAPEELEVLSENMLLVCECVAL